MRYIKAGTVFRSIANSLRRRGLNVDEMSDYMRRDIGLIDGGPACGAGSAEFDGRSRRLDLLALTRVAS
ncbi:hypothetical protein [Mesorhizobium sp. KR9-304]|uniref:hypothetical protein n=1 Tax=Mesorhizobium sp. KR9-304 TaxID=3156614 RepID=UPI0032B43824